MKKLTEILKTKSGFEYIKRSTEDAEDLLKKTIIPGWMETHRMGEVRMAMRVTSLPRERWTSRLTEWNSRLDNKMKTNRSVERPRNRWEDEINEHLRQKQQKK